MGYAIGFILIAGFIIMAMVGAGWFFSLLTVGITTVVLIIYFKLRGKSVAEGATQEAKDRFKIFQTIIVAIAVIVLLIGLIMWLIGISGGTEMISASGEYCSMCGGDGSFNGGDCWACDGTGAEISTSMLYGSTTDIGFLIALASALVLFIAYINKKGFFD